MNNFNLSDAVAFGYLVLVLVNLAYIYCHIKSSPKYSDMELHSSTLERELAELNTWVISDESQSNQDRGNS